MLNQGGPLEAQKNVCETASPETHPMATRHLLREITQPINSD